MHAPLLSRFTRILTVVMLALCAMVAPADSPDFAAANSRFVLAQAAETPPPATAPAMARGHDTPADTPALPDPNPRLNKKRAAFWGVTFMAATSLVFVAFGAWAIRKTPKPGQQRPD